MSEIAVSRRQVLALCGLFVVTACQQSSPPLPPRPVADPEARLRQEVDGDIRSLIAEYAATALRHPQTGAKLRPLIDEQGAHLRALHALGPSPAHPAPSGSASARATPAVSANVSHALAALAKSAAYAAERRIGQLRHASPPLARLLASIGASEATHSALLRST